MPTAPSGKIVARPMVVRACGHKQEFQEYEVDKYRAQRLAKFQKSRCAECVAKLNEEQQRAAASLPKKGEVWQQLPPGTQFFLTLLPDGIWAGRVTADGTTVEAAGPKGGGPQTAILALARAWFVARSTSTKA